MKWERIATRAREHAHKLRLALAGALELRSSSQWGRAEIEAAGLRDYARVFGHGIGARTFWRIFDRVLERDGGAGDFRNLELYLPGAVTAKKVLPAFERAAAGLPELAGAVLGVDNPNAPTQTESHLVWLGACSEWKRLHAAGAPAHKARKIVLLALAASGLELALTPRALRVTFVRKLERWIEGGYSPDALRDLRAEQSGNYRQLPISDDDRKTLTARALSGGLAKAWRETHAAGRLSAEAVQTRYLLANHRRPLKVTRNGICVQLGKERHWFRNEATGRLIGRVVHVYFNPDDLSSVYVKLAPSDKTAAVIPAAPAIPAMTATREQMQAAQASVAAHNRPARTLYQEIEPHFPKNGPSPFRRVVADAASIELGHDIAVDQAAVRAAQAGSENTERKLANFRRRFGKTDTQETVSSEAQLAAYKLLEEASRDAD